MRKLMILLAAAAACLSLRGQEFQNIPSRWKWISDKEVVFSTSPTYADSATFSVTVPSYRITKGVHAPDKYSQFPIRPQGAVNLTYSPDSTKLAFTRDNDLYVADCATGAETRLTYDGSDVILNGYASWVYYEEILGRPSMYKAFWWSPDSKKIGFYRFDNSKVPMFPIYSPRGQDGTLKQTRYPKAGETNPEVKIGMIDLDRPSNIVWADFDPKEDQYFGIPFWGPDSKDFYIAREPRVQNTIDLYAVSVVDGSKKSIYHEEYPTWLNWFEGIIFTDRGLYMSREFETGWQQIYFLSYEGSEFRRLTSGENWDVSLVRVDEKKGDVYYLARRDATTRFTLYKADKKGNITALTDPDLNVSSVTFSPDGKYFVCGVSSFTVPNQLWIYETARAEQAWKGRKIAQAPGRAYDSRAARSAFKVADNAGPDYDPSKYALAQTISIPAVDGLMMKAYIVYPLGFDPSKKYPVHAEIYGGPDTKYVRESWRAPSEKNQWWSRNGIIHITFDVRASGHNGRAGVDQIFRNLVATPVQDAVTWANYLKSLPYVQGDKIGIEGFSFGGTMTTMLLLEHSDSFCCGIAGGGVYDWMLYDTHYTERFMDTPANNPDGYKVASAVNHAASMTSGVLKLTHGTGDDNVHFQNTLQMITALQSNGKQFELMIYPDGMHGYSGAQGTHSWEADKLFWLRNLK